MRRTTLVLTGLCVLIVTAIAISCASAEDWPMWGHDASRNMVSNEKGLPETFNAGTANEDTGVVDMATTQNVAWVATLGSNTYGNPVVAGGRVYVGTNNAKPRDPKIADDYGILYCLDEATGKLLWQLASPKLAAGRHVDTAELGICSSPSVDGECVYVVTNRCEVICLDVKGQANGNQGVTDEGQYTAGPGKPPIEPGPNDADILWRYDMRYELGVFPQQQTASNPLVVGDRLYVTTCNGVDFSEKHVPSPDAPALICLDKKTGKLLGGEHSGISARTLYCNWSAPSYGKVGGKETLVFGAGDGFLYGFDPVPTATGELKELWRIDCNPPEYREKNGKPVKYRERKGPSEIISTPVVYQDKVYVAIGQDPEHTPMMGAASCVSVSYAGDKATAKIEWQNAKVAQTMSTPAIANGILILPELSGIVHGLDPATGKPLWPKGHDAESVIWGSALIADGRAYVGTESGEVQILAADRTLKVIGQIKMGHAVLSTPVAANGALYICTNMHLYKMQLKK